MKAVCTLENFKKAIFDCERVVSKQNTLPILNNILIEFKKGGIIFSATNLEIGVVSKIGAKIENEGKITISAKPLSNFINNLPKDNENIEMTLEKQELQIKSKNSRASIKGLSAEDFPLIPKRESGFIIGIENSKFKQVINKITSCVAINEVRAELTGVNVIFSKKNIFFAATDSFRLAEIKLGLKSEILDEDAYDIIIEKIQNCIIPVNTLIELNRIIQNLEGGSVEISIEDGQMFFKTNNSLLVSRLIDGKYPEYKHIMPKEYQTRLVADKDGLQKLIKISSVFGNAKSSEIVLEIDSKQSKLIIEGKSVEVGENVSEIKLDVTGPSLRITLSAKYLLDGISNITTPQVALFFNDDSSPMALKEVDEKSGEVLHDYIYIIMPIKNT